MKKSWSKISILLISIIVFSCSGINNEYYPTISKNEVGELRGASIGMTILEVKKIEDIKFLKSEMGTYLHYDYPINMGNSYTVAYDFSDENELYEIELTAFFDQIEAAETLLEDYKNTFNKKYVQQKDAEDGYLIWNANHGGKNIEVAMKNESDHYGLLNIKIRDLDY